MHPANDRVLLTLLVLLGALTAALLAYPLYRLPTPMSLNYSEGWNAFWAEAARAGTPLYSTPPRRFIVNYTPVSFHLIAWLDPWLGGPVRAGRLLAAACLLWSAANVATAAAALTGSARTAWLAALLLLLWIATLAPGRVAIDDPHYLALGLATAGLAACCRGQGRPGWLAVAAVLFATALFVKNNVLAFPLAVALDLLLSRRFRAFLTFAAAGLAAAVLFLLLTLRVDGSFFLGHLLAPRAFSRGTGLDNLSTAAAILYAPLCIGVAGLLWAAASAQRLPALALACAAGLGLLFGFGNGVTFNVWYETAAALALCTALAVDAATRALAVHPRRPVAVVALVLIVAGPVLLRAPAELYGALGRAARLPAREADFAAATATVAATAGPALCESLLICLNAGKSLDFDPYFVKDQLTIGRLSEQDVINDLRAHRWATIQLGEDDPVITLAPGERLRFTAPVMDALLANYRLARPSPLYPVLVPR